MVRDVRPSLDQVQDRFSDDIAGNHTLHTTLEDGSVVCSAVIVLDDEEVRIWFIGRDASLSDWDLCDPAEARNLIPKRNRSLIPRRSR
jgi:hypothetical protein